jgi:heme/copper-type cytochrome/quinol oxidase subunit 1
MRRAAPWLLGALGVVLVVAGVVVFAAANRGPADVGWTSYSPLQEGSRGAYQSSLMLTFGDGTAVLWTGRHLLGAGLGVGGLLVLVGLGGWLLGRRAGRRRTA